MTRRTRKIIAILALISAIGLVALVGVLFYLAPRLREGIAETLSNKTGRPVELSAFSWSVSPLRFHGEGLVIGAKPGEEAPLARLGEFSIDAGLLDLLSPPRRIDSLYVKDLELWINRRSSPRPAVVKRDQPARPSLPVIIERVVAENARIEIASSQPVLRLKLRV